MSRRPPRKPPTITPMYFTNSSVLPVIKQTMFVRYLTYLYDLENSPTLIEGKPQHRCNDLLFSFLNSEWTSMKILQRYVSAVTLCLRFFSISNISLFSGIYDPESTYTFDHLHRKSLHTTKDGLLHRQLVGIYQIIIGHR